jgi:hypothetical protein
MEQGTTALSTGGSPRRSPRGVSFEMSDVRTNPPTGISVSTEPFPRLARVVATASLPAWQYSRTRDRLEGKHRFKHGEGTLQP